MDSYTNRRNLYISKNADDRLVSYLKAKGYEICPVSSFGVVSEPILGSHNVGAVSEPISDHADVFYCRMGAVSGSPVISAFDQAHCEPKHSGPTILDTVSADPVLGGSAPTKLSASYPDDCAYNAACTGKYLICRMDSTAPEILEYAEAHGMAVINVRQGYAKCSTVVVDENSIITYDRGIAKACAATGGRIIQADADTVERHNEKCSTAGALTVLLVTPGHVLLPGMDTGFIGGASGRVGDEIVFNGDLSAHPDFVAIREFIENRGLKCKWFPEFPLTDIGSIV